MSNLRRQRSKQQQVNKTYSVELLFATYKCTNCQETISGVRVQCHVCQEVELCLHCFAAGAEMGGHKNNHAYQFHVRIEGTKLREKCLQFDLLCLF